MAEGKESRVAALCIMNKKHQIIIYRNFLCEGVKQAVLGGQRDDINMEDISALELQMKMLIYTTLDVFEDKQKLKAAASQSSKPIQTEPTYLSLINEVFLNAFQLDVYGFITNTNYKYVIVKNEGKTNNMGQKPSDEQVKAMFKSVIRAHTEMMLNPFFEGGSEAIEGDMVECYDPEDEE